MVIWFEAHRNIIARRWIDHSTGIAGRHVMNDLLVPVCRSGALLIRRPQASLS